MGRIIVSMSPRGEDAGRRTSGDIGLGNRARAELTPEAIANLNAQRRPSDRVGANAICGARLSDAAIQRRIDKGKDISNPVCSSPAGFQTPHPGVGYCKWHGGNTSSGKKSAARIAGQAFMEQHKADLLRFGGDKDLVSVSPEQALLEEVRRSVAMVRFLETAISQWQFDANPDPAKGVLGGLPTLIDETDKGNATFTDEREWLLLYRQEREHAVKVARMAIDAGIANRLVTIAEDQGRTLALAIRQVLDALNLTPEQIALVPKVVPAILRSVTQGVPMPQPAVIEQ